MRVGIALLSLVPALATGCQFAEPPEVPSHDVTLSVTGVWTGADIAVRLVPDRGESQTLSIDDEGSRSFAVPLEDRTAFQIELVHDDEHHTCTIDNGDSTIDGSPVEVVLACTSNVPVQLRLSTPGLDVDLQRSRQAHQLSYLQQTVTATIDGPPGTIALVDAVAAALGSPSTPKPLVAGANELVVRVDIASLQLSRTYVFELQRGAAFATQEAYIKASNFQADDWFGHAVAATDEYVVIGAPQEDGAGSGVNPPPSEGVQNSGAVYAYRRVEQNLVPEAMIKLGGNTPGDRFGSAVAASGALLAVGAPKNSFGGASRGVVALYRRSGGTWSYETTLRASDAADGDEFGSAVAAHGDTVVVGARLRDEGAPNQGAVYVFRRIGGTWSEVQKLSTPTARAYAVFGYAVAVTDASLAVSSYCDASAARGVSATVPADSDAPCSGAVHVYKPSAAGWELDRFIKASNADTEDRFGQSIALDGTTLVVGATSEASRADAPSDNSIANAGAAYIFEREPSGWTEVKLLKASTPVELDLFGYSVAVLGDMVAVGSGGGLGSVDVFRKDAGAWTRVDRRIGASAPDGDDQFGGAVALVRDGLIIGALMEDGTTDPMSNDARNSGAAYFFR